MAKKVRTYCAKCKAFTERVSKSATVEYPYHRLTCVICGNSFEYRWVKKRWGEE